MPLIMSNIEPNSFTLHDYNKLPQNFYSCPDFPISIVYIYKIFVTVMFLLNNRLHGATSYL